MTVEQLPSLRHDLTEYEAILSACPTTLEAIPIAACLCDGEGRLVGYNNEAVALWGREPVVHTRVERFCGSHRLFLMDGTPLARESSPMAQAIHSGRATRNAEVIMERPDGSRITALVNIRPLRDRRGRIQGAINCFQVVSNHKALDQGVQGSALRSRNLENASSFATDAMARGQATVTRHQSEQRLSATFEAANIGIVEADAKGRLLRVNNAICKILDRSREQLLAMTFLDYTHVDDREKDESLYAHQVAGDLDSYVLRKRGVRPDGTVVYLDVCSSSVRNPSGAFEYGVRVIQDVTAAQRAEERLSESERRMRQLMEALPAAVYTTDEKGRITFYNNAAIELAGRTPEVGEEWCVTWRLYNTDGTFLPHEECPMALALKENRAIRGVEAVAERPDGTRVPFMPYPTPLHDSEGRLIGAINMLVDISERKKAQDYEARLAAIVEFSDDAIISKDVSGVIQTWNKGAERLFGYKAEEVIGKPVNVLIPPDRQDEEPKILERIRRGEHIDHYETVRMRKDGELLNVSLSVSPLKDAQGRVVGASKIARDVTERRREEERRRLLVNELNHRVKNTLATVQSIAAQTFRDEQMGAAVGRFQARLIALARAHDALTRENWQGIGLAELIRQTVAPICVDIDRRVELHGCALRLKPRLALSLSMAFHELSTNAAKYGALTTDAGRINIGWEVASAKGESRLHLRWTELGGPPVEPPREKGFGSRLLERALGSEYGGEVSLSFDPSGVVCTMEISLT